MRGCAGFLAFAIVIARVTIGEIYRAMRYQTRYGSAWICIVALLVPLSVGAGQLPLGGTLMGFKTFLASHLAAYFTGQMRLESRRRKVEARRRQAKGNHVISYFHQVDDPYSHLAVQAIYRLQERYDIELSPFLVGPPADWATPERAFLNAYARQDARRLAEVSGINFPQSASEPASEQLVSAQSQLIAAMTRPDFLSTAIQIGEAIWAGDDMDGTSSPADIAATLEAGEACRRALGHFMSAMIHYGGEWYWGVDRIHYLEQRLRDLGLHKADAPNDFIWMPPSSPNDCAAKPKGEPKVIEYFLSFRSPYTYIATARVKALADAYGAKLKLRFVLPMVMRGLAVPPLKSRYFSHDAAREARRLGVPFGRICDPLGKPVERGYALLPWAIAQGRGYEFCLSFMDSVWSQGVDAGTDTGLSHIVTEAGLYWGVAKSRLSNDDWREEAEANRLDLLALGHWGVPCFVCEGTVVWGQDRLWVIEQALKA